MDTRIEKIKNFRRYLLRQLDGLTVEQLNHIPPGLNNNIIWNLGHMISAHQNICYIKANLDVAVGQKIISDYFPGTRPNGFVNEQEVRTIRELLITSMDTFQSDLTQSKFTNYSPSTMIPKVYGFEVNSIDSAIEYLLHHEGFHAGIILTLKRLV